MKFSFIFFAILALLSALPGLAERSDVFEPTVNRSESELLERAIDLAETDSESAIELLMDGTTADSSAALDFALGNLFFQSDQLDMAEKYYANAVEKMPRFKRALSNLARVQLLQDKHLQAVETLRPLLEQGRASADIYMLLGQSHLIGERYVSAESAFRYMLLLTPNSREGMLGLAKTLLEQGRYRESRALVMEMLAEDIANSELWSLRANIAAELDDIEDAVVAIESARRLASVEPRLLTMLGDIYLNRQQPEDAVAAYRESFELEAPEPSRILRAIEGFIALDALEEARAMIAQAEGSFDEDETHRLRLLQLQADLAMIENESESAEKIHLQILAEHPLSARSLLALAQIQWERGDLEAALLNCERATRIEGFEVRALTTLAQIEVERENYTEALQALERAHALEPQERIARYMEQVRRLAEM